MQVIKLKLKIVDKDTFFSKKHSINCRGKLLDLSKPVVMGILNVTPDSFYDGGEYTRPEAITARAGQIIAEGGKIIDMGAYSTRPGAPGVSEEEEEKRLFPALEIVRKRFPDIPVSIDTYRASIAQKAVSEFEADIINDISGGTMDQDMFKTIAGLKVPYILMHIKGEPNNMQKNPAYGNLMEEILKFFSEKISTLKLMGVSDIIIDPGFGFGKTLDHNYELLHKMEDFKIFELPILAGVSRKSMIYKLLESSPDQALNGTTVINTLALLKGADILRVHDVKEAAESIKILEEYNKFTD